LCANLYSFHHLAQSFPANILTGRNRIVVIGLDSDAGNPGSNPVCDSNYKSVHCTGMCIIVYLCVSFCCSITLFFAIAAEGQHGFYPTNERGSSPVANESSV